MAGKVADLYAEIGARVDKYMSGSAAVKQDLTGLGSAMHQVGQVGGAVFDGLGLNIGHVASAAGIGALIVGAGKTVLELEKMREESDQLQARFVGFAGGVRQADEAFAAMDATLGNALTRDEKMAAAADLLGLKLAKNAQDAAALTHQALILGMGVEELARIMETGRTAGLVPYGISTQVITARVLELQSAQAGLTEIEARQIAIREQLAEKADAVAAAGGRAATSTQELQNAWDSFADAVADFVNLSGPIDLLTQGLQGVTKAITPIAPDLAALRAEYARLQEQAASGMTSGAVETDMAILAAEIAAAEAAAQAAADSMRALADEGRDFVISTDFAALRGELAGVGTALEDLRSKKSAADVNAVAMAIFKGEISQTEVALLGLQGALDRLATRGSGSFLDGFSQAARTALLLAEGSVLAYQNVRGPVNVPGGSFLERQEAEAEAAAKQYAAKMTRVVEEVGQKVRTLLSQGASFSIELKAMLPGGDKGPLAPGAGGPFEEIYRLQAWLKDGSWAETAEKFGVTSKAQGEAIVKAFQQGIFSPDVVKMIDKAKISELLQTDALAKASQDAFVDSLSKQSGQRPDLIKAMLGLGGKTEDGKQTGPDLTGFMPGFLGAMDKELKDNEKAIAERGASLWDVLGGAFIKQAAESGAFQAAINRMVAKALEAELS